jgi:hypothetical protein
MHLTYDLTVDGETTFKGFKFEDYIGTTAKTKQPTWYRDLSMFLFGKKNKKEYLKEYFDNVVFSGWGTSHKTAKACPAFINFFRQSLAFKTTADIYIKVQELDNGKTYDINWLVRDPFWSLHLHSLNQVGSLGDRCIVIKFSAPFSWINTEDTQYQYVDPYIANDVPYRMVPGPVTQPKGTINKLNAPVLLPAKSGEYVIPGGTTLLYLQFDRGIRSVKNKDLKDNVIEYNNDILVKDNLKSMIGKK